MTLINMYIICRYHNVLYTRMYPNIIVYYIILYYIYIIWETIKKDELRVKGYI